MKNKIIIILILAAIGTIASLGYHFYSVKSAPSINKTGLTLDLNFGNNNNAAAPTVYDTSGFNRHATSTAGSTSPTCGGKFCSFDATNDHMEANATNVFNSANLSIALKFNPNFAADDGVTHPFFDAISGVVERIDISKINTNVIRIGISNYIYYIALATYQPYWKVGKENVIIITSNTTVDSHNVWLNGVLIDTQTTNLSPVNPTTINIGTAPYLSGAANAKLHYLKVWNRLLTDAEVGALSADRTAYTNSAPIAASSTLDRRLVGWWTMDANDINGTNYYDKSGFNNTATSTGSPTIATGKINQAVGLNSTTQFLNAGSGASLNLTDNFSLSAWVKTSAVGAIQMIIAKSGGGFTDGQYELRLAATGVPQFAATNGTSAFSANHNILSANTWYNLVGVMNNKVMNLYVNGAAGTSATLTGTQSTTALNTFIGRGGGAYLNNYFFNGSIDDVRIYNYALSAADVANLYSSAKTKYVASAPLLGLVGYWTMDTNDMSSTGATLYDKSGFNNNGTVTGTTTSTGKIGQARSFDGVANQVSFTAPNWPSTFSTFTISAWVKTNTKTLPNSYRMALTLLNTTYISLKTDGTAIPFCSFNINGAQRLVDNNTAGLNINEWYLVTCVYDGSNLKMYMNGTQTNQTTGLSGVVDASLATKTIGSYPPNPTDRYWSGAIDDVRIYDRALSAAEVANLYSAGKVNYIK